MQMSRTEKVSYYILQVMLTVKIQTIPHSRPVGVMLVLLSQDSHLVCSCTGLFSVFFSISLPYLIFVLSFFF